MSDIEGLKRADNQVIVERKILSEYCNLHQAKLEDCQSSFGFFLNGFSDGVKKANGVFSIKRIE